MIGIIYHLYNNEFEKRGLSIFLFFFKRSDKYELNKDDNWYLNSKDNKGGLYIGSLVEKAKKTV